MTDQRQREIWTAARVKMEEAIKDQAALKLVRLPFNIYQQYGSRFVHVLRDDVTQIEVMVLDVYNLCEELKGNGDGWTITTYAHKIKDLKYAAKMRKKWAAEHAQMNREMDAANAAMGHSYY